MNKTKTAFLSLLFVAMVPQNMFAMNGGNGTPKGNGVNTYLIGGFTAATSCVVLYYLYKFFTAEPDNSELSSRAQVVYDEVHEKYGDIDFIYHPAKMNITHEGRLFELSGHRDIARHGKKRNIATISIDLPQLQKQINILSSRIHRDQRAGKLVDHTIHNLLKTMEQFADRLNQIKKFWDLHSGFFSMHSYLQDLSEKYSNYDYNQIQALQMKIRGELGGQYPYKTFVEQLSSDIRKILDRIKGLRHSHYSLAILREENQIVDANYRAMISQAENFAKQCVFLRDVVANFQEYKQEMQQYSYDQQKKEELEIKRKEVEAKERQAKAAEEKVKAEKKTAQAIKEKAEKELQAAKLKAYEQEQKTKEIIAQTEKEKLEFAKLKYTAVNASDSPWSSN